MRYNKTRNITFVITTISLSLVISIVVAEIFFRIIGIGYGNSPHESDPILHHVNPKNYTFVSHNPTGEYGGHTVYYDKNGLISDPLDEHNILKDSRFRIAFMGDSFTEAKHIAFSDSFVGRLKYSRKKTTDVRNYGVSSYSPILYLLQWRERVKAFKPTHVIVQLYSNDISSDKKYLTKAIYSQKDELLAIPGPSGHWITKQLRKSYLVRFLRKTQLQISWSIRNMGKADTSVGKFIEENPDISDLSKKIMLKLADEVKASGAQFAMMVVPSKFRLVNKIYQSPEPQFSDKWKKWARYNSIDFIDLVQWFEEAGMSGQNLFFDQDIHFNVNGHEVVAKAISEKYHDIFFP